MEIRRRKVGGVKPDASRSRKREDVAAGFDVSLQGSLDEQELNERLRRMIDQVTEQGKRLADRLDPDEMREYRRRITEFIDTVVSNAHKLAREQFIDHDGSHRVYSVVKLIDEDLNAMAQGLLDRERTRLRIVSRSFEIRGMLLDIVM